MRTLVVPDIHERIGVLKTKIEPLFPNFDQIVFLGDWFDTFQHPHPGPACDFINKYIFNDRFVFLLGNHDVHYRWKHPEFACSGYRSETAEVIKSNLTEAEWVRFRISYEVGPYLLSHAGYHPRTLKYRGQEARAIAAANEGSFHPIFAAGQARGGRAMIGGPLWLDWNWEFEPIEGLPQIVGHTVHKDGPSHKGPNFCIDTGLRNFGIIDDGPEECTFKIERT